MAWLPHIAALCLAIGLTPWLISSLLLARTSRGTILAGWGPAMITVNVLIPITLHLSSIPITPDTLTTAHLVLASLVLILWRVLLSHHPKPAGVSPESRLPPSRPLIAGAILFAILVLPVTHIAGIDTYKWQDLASNVAIEHRISWLIHPLSLFGFTPRAYSSAQPLILASIQMLGHTGIDWGFYILSLSFGLTGFAGAWLLGRHLFNNDRSADWLALFYGLAPIFMRYNYWATGRGLLVALLPLYLLILLKMGATLSDKPTPQRRPLLWLILGWILMSCLLMMAHKAGVVGVFLLPVLLAISPTISRIPGSWGFGLLTLLALASGLLFTQGNPILLATRLVTRFGWLLPLALFALATRPSQFHTPPFRALFTAGLGTLVLSCTADMYGALLALPFIACLAAGSTQTPLWKRALGTNLSTGLVWFAIAIPALAIVLNQMRDSPSEAIYRVAQFIEKQDPRGPFRIEAPGPARHQIQAYTSGCPRFGILAQPKAHVTISKLHPVWTGNPSRDARNWIGGLRNILELQDASTDWYGQDPKIYYVTIDGKGIVPAHAKLLYSAGNASLFE